MGKVVKSVGGALGLGKKKKAAVEQNGPVITSLDGATPKRKRIGTMHGIGGIGGSDPIATILTDKLGG